jgi:hypothetical protein
MMIDEVRAAALAERIEATQEAANESYKKFSELLTLIDDFYTNIDGYPAQSIGLLKEVIERLQRCEEALCVPNTTNMVENNKVGAKIGYGALIFFLIVFCSFLGTLFHGLMFHG